jgi:hypothetical protein
MLMFRASYLRRGGVYQPADGCRWMFAMICDTRAHASVYACVPGAG